MKHFKEQDNPLNGVKVKIEELNLGSKIEYMLIHGTLEGWKPQNKIESMESRQKRERQTNF